MSRRPAGALAGIAMILSLAAPAGAAAVGLAARTSLEVPHPQVPLRDAVIQESGRSAARISATASSQRYPIHDGSDATIAVSVTAACAENCEVKDPQRVADFVGRTLGPEATLWNRWSRGMCYGPAYTIMGGTSNVLRNILGERVLGLPKEPAAR